MCIPTYINLVSQMPSSPMLWQYVLLLYLLPLWLLLLSLFCELLLPILMRDALLSSSQMYDSSTAPCVQEWVHPLSQPCNLGSIVEFLVFFGTNGNTLLPQKSLSSVDISALSFIESIHIFFHTSINLVQATISLSWINCNSFLICPPIAQRAPYPSNRFSLV